MQVINVCGLMSISDSSKIQLAMLVSILAEVASMSRYIEVDASIELLINCGSSAFGKWLSIDVLGFNARHETCIAWDMLRLDVLSRPTNPVLAFLGLIGELNLEVMLVLGRYTWIQDSFGMRNRSSAGHQRACCVIKRMTWLINDDTISLTRCLAKDLHLFGDVSCVAREIFLSEIDFFCHITLNNWFS